MCLNKKWIINQITGQRLFVPCGCCSACLQEKALRMTNIIRQHCPDGSRPLFVTLTYARYMCPYFNQSDFDKIVSGETSELPIYRDSKLLHNGKFKKDKQLLKTIDCDVQKDFKFRTLKHEGKHGARVGVIYYKDVQDFIKRFRQRFFRAVGKTDLSFYAASEYGPTTLRPHFHLLVYVPYEYEDTARDLLVKSWPFGNKERTRKHILSFGSFESYVSSYVNCFSSVPAFLWRYFKPKKSMSIFFGLGKVSSLDSILDMSTKRCFNFKLSTTTDGKAKEYNIRLSKRAINKYFPYFVGVGTLSEHQTCQLFTCPARYSEFFEDARLVGNSHMYDFTRALARGYNRFCSQYGNVPMFEYARIYSFVWTSYKLSSFDGFYNNELWRSGMIDKYQMYDNLPFIKFGKLRYYRKEFDIDKISDNPNYYYENGVRHSKMVYEFNRRVKTKKINEAINEAVFNY